MKIARINSAISLVLLSSMLLAFAPVYASATDNGAVSKKELKVLLKTAKSPAEHHKIAEYYRQEAARLMASSKEHAALAAVYEEHPMNAALEAKHGSAVEGVTHCRRWSELDTEQAKEAEALADLHEGMAKTAEKK